LSLKHISSRVAWDLAKQNLIWPPFLAFSDKQRIQCYPEMVFFLFFFKRMRENLLLAITLSITDASKLKVSLGLKLEKAIENARCY